ncbi:MAG: hypothetical protein ACOYN5_10230 [Bacteroidales bacterium]
MEQEDYIKKQIDRLGKVFGKILADLLGFKNQADIQSGIEYVNQDFINELNLDLNELIVVSNEDFINTLLDTKKFSNENLENLGDILLLLAEETEQGNSDNNKVRILNEKSLCIFEYIDHVSACYSIDRNSKIETIIRKL